MGSPNLYQQHTEKHHEAPSTLAEQVRSGDVRALAQALSLVEKRSSDAWALLEELFPHTGHALIVGITGPTGAGKSTLVDQLLNLYRTRGLTVAVIATDPTSPYSGGAILGDRIRMQRHSADSGVFIRSMATRGAMGGLAATAADATVVMDASGRDRILIETVGVGQDEVDIAAVAHVLAVLLVPGASDDVQIAKAGILETANIFVINKSDLAGAGLLQAELRQAQSLQVHNDGWTPPIVNTVASTGAGVAEFADAIEAYESFLDSHNLKTEKLEAGWRERLMRMLRDHILEGILYSDLSNSMKFFAHCVVEGWCNPYALMNRLRHNV